MGRRRVRCWVADGLRKASAAHSECGTVAPDCLGDWTRKSRASAAKTAVLAVKGEGELLGPP
jgi:hypothetical protein